MKLEKNTCLTLRIDDLNNLGYGVGHLENGMTIFVLGALDTELVKCRIILVKPHYAIAKLEEVVEPSKDRIPSPCASIGCGGCSYLHTTYEHELELKQQYISTCFKKCGLEATVLPVLTAKQADGAPEIFHYRNKVQYPISKAKDGTYLIGYYAPKSHRVVEAATCPLANPVFKPILETFRSFFKTYQLPVYEESTNSGLLRHLYFRASQTGSCLVTLVICGKELPHQKELIALLQTKHPEIVGFQLNFNEEDTNVICGPTYKLLYGTPYIEDALSGVQLQISAPAFYQVNHSGAELLYKTARDMACLTKDDVLLDLFCGVGSIGLSMAPYVKQLIGIEIEPAAIECAKENAKRSNIEGASFYCGDATNFKTILCDERQQKFSPTILVVDPPRKGLTPELIQDISSLSLNQVLYISCNPETLARDLVLFHEKGFSYSQIQPVNMFPRTGHVETVVLLSRNQE